MATLLSFPGVDPSLGEKGVRGRVPHYFPEGDDLSCSKGVPIPFFTDVGKESL